MMKIHERIEARERLREVNKIGLLNMSKEERVQLLDHLILDLTLALNALDQIEINLGKVMGDQ